MRELPALFLLVFLALGLTLALVVRAQRPLERNALPRRVLAVRIDVNRANAADLGLLPGVGPVIARHIIAHRQTHGSFTSASDLEQVKGIGPRTMQRMLPYALCE